MANRFSIETVFKAVDRVTAPVTRMQNSVSKMSRGMERNFRRMNRAVDSVGRSLRTVAVKGAKIAGVGFAAIGAAVVGLIRQFSKVENAQAAFTPLLGGVEKAQKAVEALNQTAATTPFQFETLSGVAKQLLPVMNGDIEKMIKTTRMLGDTAGGNAEKLDSITRGYVKAMLKGKTDMESLNMIAEAGVPIFQDLANVLGMNVGEKFFKAISAGKVSTEHLTKAFEKMTSAGGIFHNGMEIASKTTTGLWSTLMDNISLTAAGLGEILAPTVKDLIRLATGIAQKTRAWVTENKKLIGDKFIRFVETAKMSMKRLFNVLSKGNKKFDLFSVLETGVIKLTGAIGFLSNHGSTILKIVASVLALGLAIKGLVGVITLVNIVTAANPMVLIVAGIIAAIAAAIIWWDELKGAAVAVFEKMKKWFGEIIEVAGLVKESWKPLGLFFIDLWAGIKASFESAISGITSTLDKVTGWIDRAQNKASSMVSKVGGVFGFGGDEKEQNSHTSTPKITSLQEFSSRRVEESIRHQTQETRRLEERRQTVQIELKDEMDRMQVNGRGYGPGLNLVQTGAF